VTTRVLALRTVLLLVSLIFSWSSDLSADNRVAIAEPHRAACPESKPAVALGDWLVVSGRVQPDATRDNATHPFTLFDIRSSATTTVGIAHPRVTLPGAGGRIARSGTPSLIRRAAVTDSAFLTRQQAQPPKDSWIGRHPVLFGSIVGFGVGFAFGYFVVKHDGIGYGVDEGEMGTIWGLVGAGGGALVGGALSGR